MIFSVNWLGYLFKMEDNHRKKIVKRATFPAILITIGTLGITYGLGATTILNNSYENDSVVQSYFDAQRNVRRIGYHREQVRSLKISYPNSPISSSFDRPLHSLDSLAQEEKKNLEGLSRTQEVNMYKNRKHINLGILAMSGILFVTGIGWVFRLYHREYN